MVCTQVLQPERSLRTDEVSESHPEFWNRISPHRHDRFLERCGNVHHSSIMGNDHIRLPIRDADPFGLNFPHALKIFCESVFARSSPTVWSSGPPITTTGFLINLAALLTSQRAFS